MKLGALDHFTILTTPGKLAAIESFYHTLLGFNAGARPDFPFPGRWLYHGDQAVLHLVGTLPEATANTPARRSECIEHVAFKAQDAAAFRKHLQEHGIPYNEASRAMAGYQIFVRDPAGVRVEFNFGDEEAAHA